MKVTARILIKSSSLSLFPRPYLSVVFSVNITRPPF